MNLGKYELHEVIGKGGFGTVYRATDTILGRVVAIKVLNPTWMAEGSEAVERFRREARVMAQLDHPNVVTVHEVGEESGKLFIVMRYYPGKSLAEKIQAGPIPFDKIVPILQDVCAGLQAAHARGWVHRDLKPGNILFDADGRAVVSDFGLARAVELSSSLASSTGMVGTPYYRAPELWNGKPPASPATDVYALGCILGEMLTGKILFAGETPAEVIARHLVTGPDFGEEWPLEGETAGTAGIVERALKRDSGKRYTNAASFIEDLLQECILISAIEGKVQTEPSSPVVQSARVESAEALQESLSPHQSAAETTFSFSQTDLTQEKDRLFVPLAEGVEMEFIRIPAGDFRMGAVNENTEAGPDEKPQHVVTLDEYWMGRYPVTNAQYAVFVKAEGRGEPVHWASGKVAKELAAQPVVNLSWRDAVAFCDFLRAKNRYLIRLPTEAEWEKAARGTDGRIYPWGSQMPNGCCNFGNIVRDTSPVGRYSPQGDSPYGCVDMSGNVWEWVSDWYQVDYYKVSPKVKPIGPNSGEYRVLRGGSWNSYDVSLRTSARFRGAPGHWYDDLGFRCVLSRP